MGALTFDALLRTLKHDSLDSVYYLSGDEDVLKDEAIAALVARAVEGDETTRDFNVDRREAADLDPATLRALLDTPPLLAMTRAVVLRGVDQIRKTSGLYAELGRYLDNPNPTTVLVLVQSAGEEPDTSIERRATSVSVQPLPPDRVARWLDHRAKQLGLTIEPDGKKLLLDTVRGDLGALAQEVDKLAAAAGSRPATRADVAELVGAQRGETLADLIEAALERRPAQASRLVEAVLLQSGMTGVRIVTALGTALVGTALARAELDRGVPPARLPGVVFRHLVARRPFGLGDWKEEAARWSRWAAQWKLAELRDALRRALAADRALKSTTVSDNHAILVELLLTMSPFVPQAA